MGTGKNEKELFPVFLSFFVKKTIKAISCGYSHSLFLTKSKNIYATGYNNHGELGLGNNLSSYLPDKISKLKHENITSISAGSHSSAITEKGDLYIWGSGVFGEFSYPQKMNSNEKFIDVEIGLGFGTGLDMNGQLYMWGENQWGQLGFGDFTPRITLTQNSSFKDKKLKKIACGGQYFIGIFEDADMSVQKRNIIDNIMNMNDMTTSKKKCQVDNMSNRKIIVNSTEIKNKR